MPVIIVAGGILRRTTATAHGIQFSQVVFPLLNYQSNRQLLALLKVHIPLEKKTESDNTRLSRFLPIRIDFWSRRRDKDERRQRRTRDPRRVLFGKRRRKMHKIEKAHASFCGGRRGKIVETMSPQTPINIPIAPTDVFFLLVRRGKKRQIIL